MIGTVTVWKALLDAFGQALAFLFDHVPGGYGVAIILLTLAMRVVLLPLAIKQIRSMQAMTAIQPKVKQIQQKYKGNRSTEARQKMNEEMMALYKQYGVNPLSGCLPLIAQFPVLIALYGVLRFPIGLPHIPNPSALFTAITHQQTSFLGTNLLCSASQAAKQVEEKSVTVYGHKYPDARANTVQLNCGKGAPSRIPYYVFAVAMVATTYYQQRQMQRASPQGSQQQQALTKVMPLLFGVWGFLFPAGLVVYWTTTNVVQILQQQFMLPKIRAAQAAQATESKRGKARAGGGDGQVKQLGDGKVEGRPAARRPQQGGSRRNPPGDAKPPPAGREDAARASGDRSTTPRPGRGQTSGPGRGSSGSGRSSGGSGGGDRKKRRKR